MSQPFIGQISMGAYNFAPRSWALCNGQLLPIQQNTAVFSLLGTTYGGNGQTNFGLPNLQGRTPIHWGQGPGLPNVSLGESGGEASHTLIANEMPLHTHAVTGSSTAANATTPGPTATWAAGSGNGYGATPPNATMNAASVPVQGGSQPHENMPPYLGVNFIICLQGVFPARN